MRGKAKLLLSAALALLVGGTALALYLRPRERPLLPRSTRIVPVNSQYPYYWWLSNDEVLLFRDPGRGDWTMLRLDVNTKTEKSIEALTRLFARSGGRPESLQVSHDGSWALWSGATGGTVVATTDGARHFEYPPGKPSEKRWMCDSVRWIELVHDGRFFTGAILHNVVHPHESLKRPMVPSIPCSEEFVNVARMTPTTDDHILASLWNGHEGGIQPAAVLALALNAQISGIGQFTLHPQRRADRGELVFAPIHGRIAWLLQYRPSWSVLTREPARTGIWVTEMQDWQTHEVGSVEGAGDGKSGSKPLAVQWLPDGDRLSFIYRDALWSVPAG